MYRQALKSEYTMWVNNFV